MKSLKLGTRKSLLAWAQSQWVAHELEKLNPGLKVELVGMETQGDKIQDKPLSQIEGKEFFTAELDQALLRGDTQLTVHSMKDLSLDRPSQFTLAATPPRELPHDVILFHESVIERLEQGLPIRIGTSSPRRLTLLPEFLGLALPRFGPQKPEIQFVQIRGNVNTRLSRVHEPNSSTRKLDGVVLAFAGLERLSLNEVAHQELKRLLEHTRMMLVPVQHFPTAPAQGALAVECRSDQPDVQALIQKLHHEPTLRAIQEERKILQEWGGGCHQKLGATVQGTTLYIKGEKPNGERLQETRKALDGSKMQLDVTPPLRIEAADVFDFEAKELSAAARDQLQNAKYIFIAHARAFEFLPADLKSSLARNSGGLHLWVSGWKSWTKLAGQGLWVEGCVEGHGYSVLDSLRPKHLLGIGTHRFAFLSHNESGENPNADLIATYHHQFREIPQKILDAPSLYWGSGYLFEAVWSRVKDPESFKRKHHFCGPGKTFDRIRALGIEVNHE